MLNKKSYSKRLLKKLDISKMVLVLDLERYKLSLLAFFVRKTYSLHLVIYIVRHSLMYFKFMKEKRKILNDSK